MSGLEPSARHSTQSKTGVVPSFGGAQILAVKHIKLSLQAEAQESWWWSSSPNPENWGSHSLSPKVLEPGNLMSELRRTWMSPTGTERANFALPPSSAFCSVQTLNPLDDACLHHLPYTVSPFKCLFLLETPSQMHPEIMWYQLSQPPLARSGCPRQSPLHPVTVCGSPQKVFLIAILASTFLPDRGVRNTFYLTQFLINNIGSCNETVVI